MTLSIIAWKNKSLGIGVVSGSIAVGDRVPWVKGGVGAIATQGYTETRYGREGLRLLEEGLGPSYVLKKLLQEDFSPERRQVAILSADGRKAVHTGSFCPPIRSSEDRKNYICIGNMLKSEQVVPKMAEAFGKGGKLWRRILSALEAGAEAGGDRRGNQTAAILVRNEESLDVKIDKSQNPLRDLRKEIFEALSVTNSGL